MVKLSNLHPKNIFFAHIIGRCGFLPTWGFHSKPGLGDVTRCPFDKKYCNYFRISQYYYSVQTFVSAVKFINLIKYRFCLIWNIFMEERCKLYRYTSLSVSPWEKKDRRRNLQIITGMKHSILTRCPTSVSWLFSKPFLDKYELVTLWCTNLISHDYSVNLIITTLQETPNLSIRSLQLWRVLVLYIY